MEEPLEFTAQGGGGGGGGGAACVIVGNLYMV